MEANKNSFLSLLAGKKQFVIPVYQRPYSWTLRHCTELWEDVTRIATHQEQQNHFMGSILYSHYASHQISTLIQLEVVDGQQRIVTLSLFLVAIANTLNDFPGQADLTKEDIYSNYLINQYAKGMQR